MPNWPMTPGATTSSTSSLKTALSGVTISNLIFAIRVGAQFIAPAWGVINHAPTLRCKLLGLCNCFLNCANQIEGLLGQVVVLALDDLLEAANRISDLDVLALEARELRRHEEGLRKE